MTALREPPAVLAHGGLLKKGLSQQTNPSASSFQTELSAAFISYPRTSLLNALCPQNQTSHNENINSGEVAPPGKCLPDKHEELSVDVCKHGAGEVEAGGCLELIG